MIPRDLDREKECGRLYGSTLNSIVSRMEEHVLVQQQYREQAMVALAYESDSDWRYLHQYVILLTNDLEDM